jgi:hypothetical protein
MYVSDRTEEGVDGAHTNTLENIGRIEMGVPLHTIDWVDHREAKRHKPDLAARISGVETLDDARDSSIVAMARQFFRKRGHRHTTSPEPSFRRNDEPFKS